jgi:predicted lipoprotein
MFPWNSEADKLQRAAKKLCDASEKGDVEKVRALLKKGNVDVNKPRDDDIVRVSQ